MASHLYDPPALSDEKEVVEQVEYVDENGNPLSAEEVAALEAEGLIEEEVVEVEELATDAGDAAETVEYVETELTEADLAELDAETRRAVLAGEIELEIEYVEEPDAESVPAVGKVAENKVVPAAEPAEDASGEPSWWRKLVPGRNSALGEAPAWLISLGVHVALFLGLATVTYAVPLPEFALSVETLIEEDEQIEDFAFEEDALAEIGSDSNLNTLSASQETAQAVGLDPQELLERQIMEADFAELPPPIEMIQPHESTNTSAVDAAGATEIVGGTEGAVDRLAYEIAESLRQKDTLVVWLFDASLSLQDDRETIAARLENIERQLGEMGVEADENALKTSVIAFGQGLDLLTAQPVNQLSEAAAAIRTVPADTSGVENVFSAVGYVLDKFKIYRTQYRRNVMTVVVTDERGDDYGDNRLEQTIARCRRAGMPVYVVGPATIFGKEKTYVQWKYDDGFVEELPVDGGPETVMQERLELGFWGQNGRTLDRMSSGYGPYALTRLAYESGGKYFITRESTGPKFDPRVMANYAPDYRPISQYMRQLQQNGAKRALIAAATSTNAEDVPTPRLVFPAENDTVLRRVITEAQKPAAVFDYRLDQMMTALEQGEEDRPKLDSPRWKAGYDLAMGRVMAMRVRAYGYNVVLANMKAQPMPFQEKGHNAWRLVPSDEITAGPRVRNLAKKATEYLEGVINDHAGTPWAMLAEKELQQPLGWEWESFEIPRAPAMARNENNNPRIQLADDDPQMQRQRMQQKPRQKPKL